MRERMRHHLGYTGGPGFNEPGFNELPGFNKLGLLLPTKSKFYKIRNLDLTNKMQSIPGFNEQYFGFLYINYNYFS